MISTLKPLRPIKSLKSSEKVRLPVSVAVTKNGEEIVISRYQDAVWEFWPQIRRENAELCKTRINWQVGLPDGSKLTDSQHADLLESTKDFVWSLSEDPIEGRGSLSKHSVQCKFLDIKPLLCWMVIQGMTCFAQLEGRAMDYVPVGIRGKNGQMLAPHSASDRLSILEDLYFQRDKLNDALTIHPWPQESAYGLAGRTERGRSRKIKTKRIPESVVRQLAPKALDYVEKQATRLLNARDTIEMIISKGIKNQKSPYYHLTKAARTLGFASYGELKVELSCLRTASYIVISLFSGARNSEILALSRNCVTHGKGLDGVELIWIHGLIYKTSKTAHRWLVPPAVEIAVRVMERYSEPYRAKLLNENDRISQRLAESGHGARERNRMLRRLDMGRRQEDKLFLTQDSNSDTIQVFSNSATNLALKRFCKKFEIRDKDGRLWPLASHQFRRTYAYFVASAEMGDLQYLREHFGHWSLDMTLLYAAGASDEYVTDTDLLSEVLSEKNEKQERVLRNYLLDDVPMASGDIMLADLRRTVCTAKNKDELIRQVAEGVILTGTGHSWCIGNTKGTGCGGLCVFEADMCIDCSYGIVGPEHLCVWKEIAEQQAAALKMPDLGQPGKARSERIRDKAYEVIAKLEGTG